MMSDTTSKPAADWLAGWLPILDSNRSNYPKGDALAGLEQLAGWRQAIDGELTPRYVAAARAAGATWQQVADALGVSRQTAHERYG